MVRVMSFKLAKQITQLIQLHRMNLAEPYRDYFQIHAANNEQLRNEAYRLRFNVYCNELGWENSEHFPSKMEKDKYDHRSVHCLLRHRGSDQYAGTVRLVKSDLSESNPQIPIIEHYDGKFWDGPLNPLAMKPGTYGEISRLALIKAFRRRAGEKRTPDDQGEELFQWSPTERRRFPHIALGLYLSAATVGLAEDMAGVYAMMEPRLARHLKFVGLVPKQVGEPIDYHGIRAPYYISRISLKKHLAKPLKALLAAIADDLQVDINRNL